MWSSELRGPCVAATGADHAEPGAPSAWLLKYIPSGAAPCWLLHMMPTRSPPYATIAEVSSTDTPGARGSGWGVPHWVWSVPLVVELT